MMKVWRHEKGVGFAAGLEPAGRQCSELLRVVKSCRNNKSRSQRGIARQSEDKAESINKAAGDGLPH